MATGGFTLLELLIVLAVAALVMAIVVPRIGRLPSGLVVEKACGDLENAIYHAARRARVTGHPTRLVFDLEGKKATVEDSGGGATVAPPSSEATDTAAADKRGPDESLVHPLDEAIEWKAPEQDTEAAAKPAFVFYPNGEAAGVPLAFAVRGRALILDVDRLTGRPLVHPAAKE